MIKLSKNRRIGGGSLKLRSHLNTKIITKVRITDEQYPSSILNFSSRKDKREHPTQKPVALIEYLIKTYSNEGELILDNTAGSMTTAIAAINTNRRCICIEKDDHYFDIGSQRVKDHLSQPKLL